MSSDQPTSPEWKTNLWAPWRIEYIESLNDGGDGGCFLCDIHAHPERDEENLTVWRGRRALAVLNRFPYTGGHTLIAPADHVPGLEDLDDATVLETMAMVRDLQPCLREAIGPEGFNVGINLGHCAGAGLPGHLHVHVVPRWGGDTNFMHVIGDVRVIPAALKRVREQMLDAAGRLGLPRLPGGEAGGRIGPAMGKRSTSAQDWLASRHAAPLAPWACGEADCGGRTHAEPEHRYRGCYQRDRDRIVHCSAFRRLDFKTQVFVPHEDDHFRTRLTHTLEVAQIARTLGRALGLAEDLVEAVALAHDLGHPPFGHGGETALNGLMDGHGGFEHNRQSLRVVDYLEHPYPHFRGLNLTRTVRECLARHETRYDRPADEEFGDDGRPPLAGQLVDRADEIAYTSADLEDALASGVIETARLEGLALWQRARADAEAHAPDARPIHKRIRACKAVLSALADDLLATTAANLDTLGCRSPEDVRAAPRRCVAFSHELADALGAMQDFLLHHVYLSDGNVAHDAAGRRAITGLFAAFVDDPDRMPPRYARRVEADGLHRTVCDYIAGMTDRYCRREHERLCGSP